MLIEIYRHLDPKEIAKHSKISKIFNEKLKSKDFRKYLILSHSKIIPHKDDLQTIVEKGNLYAVCNLIKSMNSTTIDSKNNALVFGKSGSNIFACTYNEKYYKLSIIDKIATIETTPTHALCSLGNGMFTLGSGGHIYLLGVGENSTLFELGKF